MTRQQAKALALQIEAELWRREVGLAPDWRQARWVGLRLQAIEQYWRWRDQVAEEKER